MKKDAKEAKDGKTSAKKKRKSTPGSQKIENAIAVQNRHTAALMAQQGVVGTAVGLGKNGQPAIFVYLSGTGSPVVPTQLEGISVEARTTGLIYPQDDPTARVAAK